MTGSILGGNKVRKLEFELADAIAQNATDIIACGGVNSNYARSACAAALQCGLRPHAVLRGDCSVPPEAAAGFSGNMLLHRLLGSRVHVVPKLPFSPGLQRIMNALAEDISGERVAEGERSRAAYILPIGGSGRVGLFGYIRAWWEVVQQQKEAEREEAAEGGGAAPPMWSDVFVAAGSGGTAAGLAIANYLAGTGCRVHAVTVCDSAEYFLGHCQQMLDELELDVRAGDILSVVDGYKGAGYGLADDADVQWQVEVSHASGLLVDPTYTGKGLRGAVEAAAQAEDERFRPTTADGTLGQAFHGLAGLDLLFWHTGGIFGAMDQAMADRFEQGKLQSACQPSDTYQDLEKRA